MLEGRDLARSESIAVREAIHEALVSSSLSVTTDELSQLVEYWALLRRWNSRLNLTSLPLAGAIEKSIDRLIVEPARAARHVAGSPTSWLDLGSGGGSPAVPIKVIRSEVALWMVESRSRKVAFLREVVRALGLPRVAVLNDRIENLATRHPGAGTRDKQGEPRSDGVAPFPCDGFDLMTVRAVRLDDGIVGAVLPLMSRSAQAVLFGSPNWDALASRFEASVVVDGIMVLTRKSTL